MARPPLTDLYPESAKQLLAASGKDLVRRLGADAIRQVIAGVLSGDNLRNETELLTRRKIALSTGALLVFFMRGVASRDNFLETLPERAYAALKTRSLSKQDRWILNWLLGLTGKAVQNVLRDDVEGASDYISNYKKALEDAAAAFRDEYGELAGELNWASSTKQVSASINWDLMVHLLGASGTQAMTIRGSDKSTYGKLFERLILGSLLSILGFKLIDPSNDGGRRKMVFWLSERKDKRESDATAVIAPGIGVRFDIGFTGRGNTEISLDKVSRFEREMEFGRKHHSVATFIIVDRIGRRSRMIDLARKIDGTVIQMSMSFWPREVATSLARFKGFHHPLVNMKDADVPKYVENALRGVAIEDLSSGDWDASDDTEPLDETDN